MGVFVTSATNGEVELWTLDIRIALRVIGEKLLQLVGGV